MYLVDIISFGGVFDSALHNRVMTLKRLQVYRKQLKFNKCHLFKTSVPFLGHIVGRGGLQCVPSKIDDVKSLPVMDCKEH